MTRPDRCRVPVLLSSPDLIWPARCSRDTAKVAVFRLASSPPDRGRFRLIGKCDLLRLDPPNKAIDRSLMRPVTVALFPRPDKKPVPPSGGYPDPAQRPEGAPLQGAKVTSRRSDESEPLMRRADESLSVLREYDQQRRTFREAVCEERAGAAAGAGASRQARGVILSTGLLRKSKGGDVKRVGASARRVNMTDRSSCQQMDRCDMHCVSRSIAARVARFVHLRRTRPCSVTGSCFFVQFRGSPRGKGPGPR